MLFVAVLILSQFSEPLLLSPTRSLSLRSTREVSVIQSVLQLQPLTLKIVLADCRSVYSIKLPFEHNSALHIKVSVSGGDVSLHSVILVRQNLS